MSFFGKLFRNEKSAQSAVLIDIGAESVAGAYAHFVAGELPTLLHTHRLPIMIHDGEPHDPPAGGAVFRALKILGDELIRDGAPVLLRATGSGRSDTILVSIEAPWQETVVRTENFERRDPFIFTETILSTALEKTRTMLPEKSLVNESIIGTILNGYETQEPYGREVRRASVTVLTSFVDEKIIGGIHNTLRSLFHTRDIRSIAGSSLRYQAMKVVFPHGRESQVDSFQQEIDAADQGNLWLPGNPPKTVPVLPSHLGGLVRHATATPPDRNLLLMALYHDRFALP